MNTFSEPPESHCDLRAAVELDEPAQVLNSSGVFP